MRVGFGLRRVRSCVPPAWGFSSPSSVFGPGLGDPAAGSGIAGLQGGGPGCSGVPGETGMNSRASGEEQPLAAPSDDGVQRTLPRSPLLFKFFMIKALARVGERLAAFFFFALPGLLVLRRAIRQAWSSFR